jgi:hypothetical protein
LARLKAGKKLVLRSRLRIGSQGQGRLLKLLIRTERLLNQVFEVGQAE